MLLKTELEKLYKKGLSMREISERTGWSYHRVKYWMQKYNIPRRSISEAIYLKNNPNGEPFKIKRKLTKKEMFLKGLGLGIYWGEGDKSKSVSTVAVSNTNPYLLKKFIEFLNKIYGVKREKLKYNLIIFNRGNKKKAVNFWIKYLNIKKENFGKITIIPPQGKGTYRKKSLTGVSKVAVYNKKLKNKILKTLAGVV